MKHFEVIVLNKPNVVDFAVERNNLLKDSKFDWVLFLDSDEQLVKKITKIDEGFNSWFVTRSNYFLGTFVGVDYIVRLVKKGTGKFVRQVHEVWRSNSNFDTGLSNIELIHNTADNLSEYLNKINKYSDLHAMANLKEGKHSTLFKIIFFPIGKFILTLVKSKHIVFSIMQSLHSYLSWTKLYFLQH